MGCCVSSATGKKKDTSVSGKNIVVPPSFVDKETVVQEVLSRTTLLTLFNDDSTVEKKTKVPEDDVKPPGIDNVAPTETGWTEPEKESEVSEICSLSDGLLSIMNKYDEAGPVSPQTDACAQGRSCDKEEVKQMKSQGVRQRSPAKSRNEMSPLKRNIEGGGGSVRLVQSGTGKRDPTERSERRSRNRSVMGPRRRRSQQSRDSQSTDRVRLDPNENGSEQNRKRLQWSIGNYDSMPNNSFEEPLAALECFIFL